MSAHICCSCGTEHEPLLPTAPGAAMCPQCKRQAAILLAGATIDEATVENAEKGKSSAVQ